MIKPLTSLRFLFAIMVFTCHLRFIVKGDSKILLYFFNTVFREGFIGVSFFFMLSGFIISYSYYEKIRKHETSKKQFIVARIARIYPLHILTLIASLSFVIKAFLSGNMTGWFLKLFANTTLTQSFYTTSDFYFSFNQLSWSVSNELFFYLLFPFLVFVYSKLTNVQNSFKVALIAILLAIVPILMFVLKNIDEHRVFFIFPPVRLVDFMIGNLLYFLFAEIKKRKWNINFNFMELCACIIFILFFIFHNRVPEVYRFSVYYWLPISMVILVFAFQGGKISEVLSNNNCVLLGEISFGFYMFHLLVLNYFYFFNVRIFNIEDSLAIALIIFTVTLIVSYLSYFFVEKPLNKFIKEKFS